MTCEERKDLILLYVSGALEPAEAAELRGHLAGGCPACAGALTEAEATVHRIPLGLDPQPVPEGAWEKIETRIALKDQIDDHTPATLAVPFAPQPRNRSWMGWAAAAVLVVALGVPLRNAHTQLDRDQISIAALKKSSEASLLRAVDLEGKLNELNASNTSLAMNYKMLESKYQAVEKTLNPEFAFSGKDMAQPNVQGKVVWHRLEGTLSIEVSNVRPPEPGKAYELWIVAENGERLAGGMASPDAAGKLVMRARVPASAGVIGAAAFTDEPEAGVQVATGSFQFLANMKQ